MNVGTSRLSAISVITPCFNARGQIAETINSVLANSAFRDQGASLQYIVVDGGSTDGTQELVSELFARQAASGHELILESGPDQGMYDALAKGLRRVRGDACAYINSGDFYSPQAFEVALDLLARPDVRWLTGLQVRYNERSHMLSAQLPYCFRDRLIKTGIYDGRVLPSIQQESTFWHRSLVDLVDLDQLAKFRYAGDHFLWRSFARQHSLHIVEAWLGGFKVHRNQLSENMQAYLAEMAAISDRPKWTDRFQAHLDRLVWHSPNRLKRWLNRDRLFRFDFGRQEYVLHGSRI